MLAVGGNGLPTHITLTGTYTDYRSTQWGVKYTVYLGKNNYDNFHIDRNSEYSNTITIKGIRNNDDYGNGKVWLDHRVDVTGLLTDKSVADHITITRETLIDSHIEVRPLRVKWDEWLNEKGEKESEYDGVRVYLPTDDKGNLIDWIGIERFSGENCRESSTYCYHKGQTTGKRKYFTNSLISELQNIGGEYGVQTDKSDNNRKFIYLENGECAWIYFDENTPGEGKTTSGDRDATINLAFYKGETVTNISYKVIQQGIKPVANTNYMIESYEEYLHSYDSYDKYDFSTSPVDYTQKGLSWGDNKTFSESKIVSASDLIENDITGIQSVITARYDYLLEDDEPDYNYYIKQGNQYTATTYGSGISFTNIVSEKAGLKVMDMGTMPINAYQYCLSKNKFREVVDSDNNTTIEMEIHWYLPDTNELSAVLDANDEQDNLTKLKSDAYYWSSQPSYESASFNIGSLVSFKKEVATEARAVSVSDRNKSVPRNETHRVRCFYSKNGEKANMTNRVPDGMGGNYNFWMKAWANGLNSSDGYFRKYLPNEAKEKTTTDQPYSYPDVTIPSETQSDPFNYVEIELKGGGTAAGFAKDPSNPDNWEEVSISISDWEAKLGYYKVLDKYQGLTSSINVKLGEDFVRALIPDWVYSLASNLIDAAVERVLLYDAWAPNPDPESHPKSATEIVTTSSSISVPKKNLITATDLTSLDPEAKLGISFAKGYGDYKANENDHYPQYNYDQVVSQVSTTTTQNWIAPTYTGITYTKPDSKPETLTATRTGSAGSTTNSLLGGSKNQSRKYAFEGTDNTINIGAYKKAKKAAEDAINELLKSYPDTEWNIGQITYSPSDLKWDDGNAATRYYNETTRGTFTKTYSVDCDVTITASVTVSKKTTQTLYNQNEGTGKWTQVSSSGSGPQGPFINSDELRIYSGNTFTISLGNGTYVEGGKTYKYSDTHEITKVKVYISGGNRINDDTVTDTYGRFIEANLIPGDSGEGETQITNLAGMEYSANSAESSSEVWQQWSGNGRSAVTLVLADCDEVPSGLSWSGIEYTYSYYKPRKNFSSYVVVDRIEVKCTRKSTNTGGTTPESGGTN